MQILALSASLIGLLDILCHCDLSYLLNSFVSVPVCYRSMPVITYVINCIQCMLLIYDKCPPVLYLPSHARLNDQDGRHTSPTIFAATCKVKSVVQHLLEKCSCFSTSVGKVSLFSTFVEKCRCCQLWWAKCRQLGLLRNNL